MWWPQALRRAGCKCCGASGKGRSVCSKTQIRKVLRFVSGSLCIVSEPSRGGGRLGWESEVRSASGGGFSLSASCFPSVTGDLFKTACPCSRCPDSASQEEKKRKREKEHGDTEGEADDFDPGKKVDVEPPPDRPVRACRTQPGEWSAVEAFLELHGSSLTSWLALACPSAPWEEHGKEGMLFSQHEA